jgi:excisionase family DNA binding protein
VTHRRGWSGASRDKSSSSSREVEAQEGQTFRLLTADEAADLLSVPVTFVRQETRAERMPYVALGARYKRYEADALRTWWESRRRGPQLERRAA